MEAAENITKYNRTTRESDYYLKQKNMKTSSPNHPGHRPAAHGEASTGSLGNDTGDKTQAYNHSAPAAGAKDKSKRNATDIFVSDDDKNEWHGMQGQTASYAMSLSIQCYTA